MDYEGSYASVFKKFYAESEELGPVADASTEVGLYSVVISYDGSVIWLGSQPSFYGSDGAANGLTLYYRLSDSVCAKYKTNLYTAATAITDIKPFETTSILDPSSTALVSTEDQY